MRVQVSVAAFHDMYVMGADEDPPVGSSVVTLADGKRGIRYTRHEDSQTSISYPSPREDYAQYLEGQKAAGRPPEHETLSEYVDAHLRHVMGHHTLREHWTGVDVKPDLVGDADEDASRKIEAETIEKYLRSRYAIKSAKTGAAPDVLDHESQRSLALSSGGPIKDTVEAEDDK